MSRTHELILEQTAIGSEMIRATCRCGMSGVWRLNELTARMDFRAHREGVHLKPVGEIGPNDAA
jgi:hypothetical protein